MSAYQFSIENEAKVAAVFLAERSIMLNATPLKSDMIPARTEGFDEAMENMARVVDRWREERAPAKRKAA